MLALLLWIVIAIARGSLLTLELFELPLTGAPVRNFAPPDMLWAAAIVYVACLGAAVITRALRPRATFAVTGVVGAIVTVAGAIGSGTFVALAMVVAMYLLAWLLGSAMLTRLPLTAVTPLVSAPIAVALGLGTLGSALFLLAALTALTALSVLLVVAALLIATLVFGRASLAARLATLRQWQPAVPSWFETLLAGLVAGLLTFAVLAAFVPEVQTDATREHLPIAREIWQTGSVAEFPPMGVSRDPVQGHLLYAAAYGFAGATASTLVQTFAGLVAIAGVAALGYLVAGRLAAVASSAIFGTMPMVLWQLGHAFMDLFPVLFMVTAAAGILLWQRDGAAAWLILAGALAGFGFASKVTMGWSIAGLLAAIFLVGRAPWRWRDRVIAAMAFVLGALVIVPWLVRGYAITGTLPGAGFALELLGGALPQITTLLAPAATTNTPFLLDSASHEASVSYLQQRGLGHTPTDFLRAPWALTFHGDQFQYPLIGRGEIGIALLMLLPLALVGPRNRATAFLAVAALVSYAIWFLTPFQIARHLLPTLAIASALAGAGVASAVASARTTTGRALSVAAQAGLILGCLAVPFLLLPSARAVLPVDLLLGRESPEAFVRRAVPSATALLASSDLLPPETPVAYIGGIWEGPQIYTEARLTYVDPARMGSSPEEILANFARIGVEHMIWNRADSYPADWRSTLFSSGFLQRHTRILAGDRDAYLFEILQEPETRWGTRLPGNLLDDPEFTSVRAGNGPWVVSDRARVDNGVVTLQRRSAISQEAPVSAGQPYMLTTAGRCNEPGDNLELAFHWRDDAGAELQSDAERVLPGTEPGEQFLWRHAPPNATAVTASVAATGSAVCELEAIALHPAP